MVDRIIEAMKRKVRVRCSTSGNEGRFVFEPHVIYTDPEVNKTLVAGYFCGPVESVRSIRRWTEFEVKRLDAVYFSHVRFELDSESADLRSRIPGKAKYVVC